MEIRKATYNDIDLIVKNRFEFINSFYNVDFPVNFEGNTFEFLLKHIQDDSLLCQLAIESNKIVSIAMLCIYDLLPTVKNPSGKTGYIFNVYTLKCYRNKGLSTILLKNMIEEAKELGIGKIFLATTDDGLPIYTKLGFKLLDTEMVLEI